MNNAQAISWETFKKALIQNQELELQFRYAEGKLVNATYHITEIKQAGITSVDCGGVLNYWKEIIVQLWVPENDGHARAMKVSKALSIINLVEKALPLDANASVKIEFGYTGFDTRQMLPNRMVTNGDSFIIDLQPDAVQCKAEARGGSCGVNDKNEECCSPITGKTAIKLQNLAAPAETCCTPGGGCC